MSPLARPDVVTAGALGRRRTHRRHLLPSRVTEAERIAAQRVAEQARERLEDMGEEPSFSTQNRCMAKRRSYCPDCAQDTARAAWQRLNGDDS